MPVYNSPLMLNCCLNKSACVQFELDTGAGCSIISESVARSISTKIYSTSRKVTAYDGGDIELLGETFVLFNFQVKCFLIHF